MMVVVLVLGLTQAKLSGGNVNYNSEGWNESPATLDNNPEFLLALRGGRKKKISPCVTIPLARAHKREKTFYDAPHRRRFFSFLFSSRLFLHLFFLFFFFFGVARVARSSRVKRVVKRERERRKPWRVANFSICLLQLCEQRRFVPLRTHDKARYIISREREKERHDFSCTLFSHRDIDIRNRHRYRR